jgi:hypothetical protein
LARRNPDRATVLAAIDELRRQAESASARVSVLALAKRVGLANTMFRRLFPDITEQIIAGEYNAPRPSADSTTSIKDRSKILRPSCANATETCKRTLSLSSPASNASRWKTRDSAKSSRRHAWSRPSGHGTGLGRSTVVEHIALHVGAHQPGCATAVSREQDRESIRRSSAHGADIDIRPATSST